jgi:hypothetical protein
MTYSVEMGSGAIMYQASFTRICSANQKLTEGGYTSHKHNFIFLNKESRPERNVGCTRNWRSKEDELNKK